MVDQRAGGRLLYVDNLMVFLIALVIAGHTVAGYPELEWWPYSEMKEVELAALTQWCPLRRRGAFRAAAHPAAVPGRRIADPAIP